MIHMLSDKIERHTFYIKFYAEIIGNQAGAVNFVECLASHVFFVRLMVLA
jgi:hypothetical protein